MRLHRHGNRSHYHYLSSGFDHHHRWSIIFNQALWLLLIRGETSQSAALRNQGSPPPFTLLTPREDTITAASTFHRPNSHQRVCPPNQKRRVCMRGVTTKAVNENKSPIPRCIWIVHYLVTALPLFLTMLCMPSPAAVTAINITYHAGWLIEREGGREGEREREGRQMASINFSWVPYSSTIWLQPSKHMEDDS